MPDPIILGYRWPKLTTCPRCASQEARILRSRGEIQQRRCTCCGHPYQIPATHREVDTGAGVSELEPL